MIANVHLKSIRDSVKFCECFQHLGMGKKGAEMSVKRKEVPLAEQQELFSFALKELCYSSFLPFTSLSCKIE